MFTALYLKVLNFFSTKMYKRHIVSKRLISSIPELQPIPYNGLVLTVIENLHFVQFTTSNYDGIATIHHMRTPGAHIEYIRYPVIFWCGDLRKIQIFKCLSTLNHVMEYAGILVLRWWVLWSQYAFYMFLSKIIHIFEI